MSKKCIGCGAILQTENPDLVGYINDGIIAEGKYCERCFKIKNYNLKYTTNLENINNYILETINKNAKSVYFLIDFLNICDETINTFKSIKVKKTLVISKMDIIPKSIKIVRLKETISKIYGITDRIIFQSTLKDIHTDELINSIENNNENDIYIVGYTNSGKSTLINELVGNDNLTISVNPNTTIDFIKINCNGIIVYDSPGFVYDKTIYSSDNNDLIKRVIPKKFINPITYQTKEITHVQIEDLFEINTSNQNSLTFYMSNALNIKRVFANEPQKQLNLPEKEIKIPADTDLIIKSLGFINIKKECTIKIKIEDMSLIEVRNSIF